MKKLQKEFERFNDDIKIDSEADALRSKRDKLKKDVEDKFPAECKKLGIEITKSDLRFINQGSYKIGTTIASKNGMDLDYAVIMPLDIDEQDDPREIKKAIKNSLLMNCTPFVRQYDILSNKWGVLLCQKEYRTKDIRRNLRNW